MARSQMMIQTNLSLADSWFLVFTSNIVELDSVLKHECCWLDHIR